MKKSIEKILRYKPKTRSAIDEISRIIGPDKSAQMKVEIEKIRIETTKILLEKIESGKYDHRHYYDSGVNYNVEVRTICHRFRIRHFKDLEYKRISELGGS